MTPTPTHQPDKSLAARAASLDLSAGEIARMLACWSVAQVRNALAADLGEKRYVSAECLRAVGRAVDIREAYHREVVWLRAESKKDKRARGRPREA